ncbi:MAG: ATP-binding cassette domain-containing protein [Treponema sp.]
MLLHPRISFILWAVIVCCALTLPPLPFLPILCTGVFILLIVLPTARQRLKGAVLCAISFGMGLVLIHSGIFQQLFGLESVPPAKKMWALTLWMRITAITASGQLWLALTPFPVLTDYLFSGALPPRFAYLLTSPFLFAVQIKHQWFLIREAQQARGIAVNGSARERFSSLYSVLYPLIMNILTGLPARSAALDMKAFGLSDYPSDLCKIGQKNSSQSPINPAPALRLEDVIFSPRTAAEPLFIIPAFTVNSGSCTLICGGNGCGKSTFALLLSGGYPEYCTGVLSGTAAVFGIPLLSHTTREWAPIIQTVFQNPQLCFSGCTFTVKKELEFGLRNLHLPDQEIEYRIQEAAEITEVSRLYTRSLEQLSGGEAQRTVIACALAMRPKILILDEAFSRIQADAYMELLQRIGKWAQKYDVAVIILERTMLFAPYCSAVFQFKDQVLHPANMPHIAGTPKPAKLSQPSVSNRKVLRIEELEFRWPDNDTLLLDKLTAGLAHGERTVLTGANGAGKSTLLRLCGGLLKPSAGTVYLEEKDLQTIGIAERASKIGFLFQEPERQIFHSTVRSEVLFALRKLKISADEKEQLLHKALEETGLSGKEYVHPLDLHSAERRMVALASLSIREPDLLLLDEPTRELDGMWMHQFEYWLSNRKAGVVAISHDPAFIARNFSSVWNLKNGTLSFS